MPSPSAERRRVRWDAERALTWLHDHGPASPHEIAAALGCSWRSAYRNLADDARFNALPTRPVRYTPTTEAPCPTR